jgi:hypothetical protein
MLGSGPRPVPYNWATRFPRMELLGSPVSEKFSRHLSKSLGPIRGESYYQGSRKLAAPESG